MSDNQRRAICRVIFILLCLVPTGVSGYWICHPQTPEGWAQALKAELGIATTIDSVETPGPYETWLTNPKFSDADGNLIFETVEARIKFGEQNVVQIPFQVKGLNQHGLAYLVRSINQHVIRTQSARKIWRFQFDKDVVVTKATKRFASDNLLETMQWDDEANRVVLSNLQIHVYQSPTGDGSTASMQFFVKDPATESSNWNKAEMLVSLSISKSPDRQAINVNTNSSSLPCWLCEDALPQQFAALGENASYSGGLELLFSPDQDLRFEARGVFQNVDLQGNPAVAPGTLAEIELDDCEFVAGKFKAWDAVLKMPRETVRVHVQDLFLQKQELSLANAFSQAIAYGRSRVAHDPRESGNGLQKR